MRRYHSRHLAIFTLFLVLALPSCGDSGPTAPETLTDIPCTVPGLGSAHPQSAALQQILDRYVGGTFPGMAAAVLTPDGLWVGAAGLADVGGGIRMSPCHTFFSGSVAKTYTATAAMRLVEDGRLGLDDAIADYLPTELAQNLPNASTATVRQLLNHSAGMPDHDDDAALDAYVESHNGSLPSAVQQLAFLYDDPARFTPGSMAQYSSAHTLTLSLVVDSASGSHHSDIVSNDILSPIGLTNTWYKNEPGYPSPPNLVAGYLYDEDGLQEYTQEAVNYANTSQGDAGVFATVEDYYGFLRSLMEGQIVADSTVAAMRDPFVLFDDGNVSVGLGFGLFVITQGSTEKVGHSGQTLGGMVHLYHYPESNGYIALATNVLTDDVAALKAFGAELVFDASDQNVMSELEALVR